MAHLKIQIGDNIFQLREIIEAVSIGRGDYDTNDITINDARCSRSHARIYFEQSGGEVIIEDEGSSYGTFVNNERIEKKVLKNNDLIAIADQKMYYVNEQIPPSKLVVDYRNMKNMNVDWRKVLQSVDVSFVFPTVYDIVDQGLTVVGEKINLLAKVGVVDTTFFNSIRSAISNAVQHGNQNHSGLCIFIRMVIIQNRILIEIRDQGKGFNYITALEQSKANLQDKQYKGLGFKLMISGASQIEWNFVGNQIRLWKDLSKQTSKLQSKDIQTSLETIKKKQTQQIF